jgi:hypothetical protein
MVEAEKLFYGPPDKRNRGRTEGMSSLSPTRTRLQMRLLNAAMVVLLLTGLWWGGGEGGPSPLSGGLWLLYGAWLAWTILGVATVWTFLAERSVRPAIVAFVAFGAVSAGLAALVW